jgi:hypothetical protein
VRVVISRILSKDDFLNKKKSRKWIEVYFSDMPAEHSMGGFNPPTPSSTEEKKKLVRKYIGGEQLGEKGGRKLEKG